MAKKLTATDKLKQQIADVTKALAEASPWLDYGGVPFEGIPAGTVMADGSVFVGLTEDHEKIFAMPVDLGVALDFNDAAKVVRMLNNKKALGHDDWQIPTMDVLKIVQRNKDRGALKDTFNMNDKEDGYIVHPNMYRSSTRSGKDPEYMHGVRMSQGEVAFLRSHKLSCRLVRLEAPPLP